MWLYVATLIQFEVFCLLICSHTLVWSRALANNREETADTSFLQSLSELSFRDQMRRWVIWERLRAEPLLFHIKRSQLRWFRHLIRMFAGRGVPDMSYCVEVPRHTREMMCLFWPGVALVFPHMSYMRWLGKGRSWLLCLCCCPTQPWMDGWDVFWYLCLLLRSLDIIWDIYFIFYYFKVLYSF